jgi:hypothetical protein
MRRHVVTCSLASSFPLRPATKSAFKTPQSGPVFFVILRDAKRCDYQAKKL